MIKQINKFGIGLLFAMLVMVSGLSAEGQVLSIPGFGDVGLEKNGSKWTVALADLGTWDFTGTFKSKKDFDLLTSIPAGNFTDYIPGAGQLLALVGLSTVDLHLKPSGLGIAINCEGGALGALRGNVTETLSKVKAIGIVIDKVISGFDVRSLVIDGAVFGKTLKGKVSGEIAVIGKTLKFDVDGEISMKKLVSIIVDKVVPVVTDFATDAAKAAYTKSKDLVVGIGKSGLGKINKAWDNAAAYAREAAKTINYATNSYDTNLNKDLPAFINAQGDPLLQESNKVLDELYYQILPMVRNAATKEEKDALIGAVYGPVNAEFDKRWETLKNDGSVRKWSTLSKRENELIRRYQEGISAKYRQHTDRRGELYNRFMAAQPLIRIPSDPKVALNNLKLLAAAKVPVVIQSVMENIAMDVMGGSGTPAANGASINFYNTNGQANQQFLLVNAGAPDTYHLQSVHTGKFVHINGAKDAKESGLVVWDGAGKDALQTVFKVTADNNGFIHFFSASGLAFDLKGGSTANGTPVWLWDNHGGMGQAFYVTIADNPVSLVSAK